MGAVRVVVYAEGGGETGETRESSLLPTRPTHPLAPDERGPAHILVRRSLEEVSDIPGSSIRFDAPLRVRGRRAFGSDLLNEKVLRGLLTWPRPDGCPDIAIVLVDCDGERNRKNELDALVRELTPQPQRIIGMSIEEFEAWLIADISVVNEVLGTNLDEVADPESMAPGEAKRRFRQWCRQLGADMDEMNARCDILRNIDLSTLANRCNAFETFLQDLSGAVSQLE